MICFGTGVAESGMMHLNVLLRNRERYSYQRVLTHGRAKGIINLVDMFGTAEGHEPMRQVPGRFKSRVPEPLASIEVGDQMQ